MIGYHYFMMASWVMFGKKISFVTDPLIPVDPELFLYDTAFHPVKTHVPGLGVFLTDGGLEETGCSVVVGFDGGGYLWVP